MKNSTRAIGSMIWLPLAAVGILGATMQAARAADQAGAPAGESSTARGGLQEVVVTATRHEESLSKVPISVTGADAGIDGSARHQGLPGRRAVHAWRDHR